MNYKILTKKNMSHHEMLILTEKNEFIARGSMSEYQRHNLLEVVSSVARPGFGTFLYQSMAKYAAHANAHIMSSRDGNTRSAALDKWDDFFERINKLHRKKIPDYLNEGVLEDVEEFEVRSMIEAYRMPTSALFIGSLIEIDKLPSSEQSDYIERFDATEDYFSISYELDGSKWIDEDVPLEDEILSYPLKTKIKVKDIVIDNEMFNEVSNNILEGRGTRSSGPIDCVIDIDGDIVMMDGHHRLVNAILNEIEEISVIIHENEYLYGFCEDVDRPNKQDIKIFENEKIKNEPSNKRQLSESEFSM